MTMQLSEALSETQYPDPKARIAAEREDKADLLAFRETFAPEQGELRFLTVVVWCTVRHEWQVAYNLTSGVTSKTLDVRSSQSHYCR